MNRTTLIETASTGDAAAVENVIRESIAKTLKKAIKVSKAELNFSAAAILMEVQPKYGDVTKKTKAVEVDMSKYSMKAELTMSNKTPDFNNLIIGYCNTNAKLIDNKTSGDKVIYTFAFIPADGKRFVGKMEKVNEVAIKVLSK